MLRVVGRGLRGFGMHRDIALGLLCLAAFGLAVIYVSQAPRFERERSAREIARLEQRTRALELRVASLSAQQRPVSSWGSGPVIVAPAGRPVDKISKPDSLMGAAGSRAAPTLVRPVVAAEVQEELAVKVLRKLLATDQQQGIAAVDDAVTSARGLNAARGAMRSMSVLAEVDDPAIDRALRGYTRAESELVRLHAAKLLEGRGDGAPLATVMAELTAELEASDDRRKLQALALLQLAADPASAAKIVPLLRDASSAIRHGAVLALSGFNDDSLHAALTPLLADPDPRVQAAATHALKRMQ
jgi:hypothetical protein